MILEQQNSLSKDQLNELIIYNQDKFYKARKNDFWRRNMTGEDSMLAS